MPCFISPLEIILELRRSLVMEESNAPQEWNAMFSNVENNLLPGSFHRIKEINGRKRFDV
jgi:hypothetical protein